MIQYLILKGIERGPVRHEPGDLVTSAQLRGWGIPNLIAIGALEKADSVLDLADVLAEDEEE